MSDRQLLPVGFGQTDITCDPQVTNWITGVPYTGVLDPLHVRALALGEGDETVVLVGWDLVDAWEEATDRCRQRLAEVCGVRPDRVLVQASHTHSAPRAPFSGRDPSARRMERLRPLLTDERYQAWCETMLDQTAAAVGQALADRRPCTVGIGRAQAAEWLFNRRPVTPEGTVETMMVPADPLALPRGLRFGPIDPTATAVTFTAADGALAGVLVHAACHPVQVYPHSDAISADWPGALVDRLWARLGVPAFFLQGCCGNIVPAWRGVAEREQFADFLAERLARAVANAEPVAGWPVRTARAQIDLPLTAEASESWGAALRPTEVQAVRCGEVALAALPGEPLIELGFAIQAESPFAHTLPAGYANGLAVSYVGLPGEKARGGYEGGPAGAGTDVCGTMLIETAVGLLRQLAVD